MQVALQEEPYAHTAAAVNHSVHQSPLVVRASLLRIFQHIICHLQPPEALRCAPLCGLVRVHVLVWVQLQGSCLVV
jgi:hypothetical protein